MPVFVRVSTPPLSICWNVPPVYIWKPKWQTATNTVRLLLWARGFRWAALSLIRQPFLFFSSSFGWVSLSASPPLWYWDQIRIKAAKTEQDQNCNPSQKLLIERICMCRLICLHYKWASLHLCEGSQICIQSSLPQSVPIQSPPRQSWCCSDVLGQTFDEPPRWRKSLWNQTLPSCIKNPPRLYRWSAGGF